MLICSLNLQVLYILQLVAKLRNSPSSLFYFHVLRSHMSKLHMKEKKGGGAVTLMFPLQFFIEAGLRGQVLRKTSLCGEECTSNKPKWHWEVQLSTMINGTNASWMCLVPLPCWLCLLMAGSRLLGLAWSSNLNPPLGAQRCQDGGGTENARNSYSQCFTYSHMHCC